MKRPSGTTAVTIGLAGIALYSVVSHHLAPATEPAPGGPHGAGTATGFAAQVQLRPDAWRAWRPGADEAALPPAEAPAGEGAAEAARAFPALQEEAVPAAASFSPADADLTAVEPAASVVLEPAPVEEPLPEARTAAGVGRAADGNSQPAAAARSATAPASKGRMGLAGPEQAAAPGDRTQAAGSGDRMPAARPAAPERARDEQAPAAPVQNPPRFGPAIFKEIDRSGAF